MASGPIFPTPPAGNVSVSVGRDLAQTQANAAEVDAQTGITNAATAEANALAAQGATIPGGRLFVPAAYWPTTSAQTTALAAANDVIDFSWIQECSMGLTSVSVYIGAVTIHGNLNLALWSDSVGTPGSQLASLGAVDSGPAAGWVRLTFDAVTLTRDTRYHLLITGSASKSYAISTNRNTGTVGTGYPSDCKSYTALAGAGTWTPLTMGGLDADFLVILNSTAGGNPQLCYGRYIGSTVNIPGTGFLTIPAAGLFIDTTGLIVSTLYYVYAYNNSGTPAIEASPTVPIHSAGLWCKTGASDHLLLGVFYTMAGPDSVVSPIDCGDWRGVANVYNKIWRTLGKRQIYAGGNSQIISVNAWTPWNQTDWEVWALSWGSAVDIATGCIEQNDKSGDYRVKLSIGLDSSVGSVKCADATQWYSAGPVFARLFDSLETGLHYLVPTCFAPGTCANPTVYYFSSFGVASFRGAIFS